MKTEISLHLMADLAYQKVPSGRITSDGWKNLYFSYVTEDRINIHSYILAAVKYPDTLLV
jgi:hypothetical protein